MSEVLVRSTMGKRHYLRQKSVEESRLAELKEITTTISTPTPLQDLHSFPT